MVASVRGRLPLVRWLLANNADITPLDTRGRNAVLCAIASGKAAIVQELLKAPSKLDACHMANWACLFMAVNKTPDILRLLLDAGLDPNLADSAGQTAINRASYKGKTDMVKILIEKGADADNEDKYGWTPICDAIRFAHDATMVRLLAESGAKLDVTVDVDDGDDFSPLHLALKQPVDILRVLLEFRKAIDIDARDSKGRTALIVAAKDSVDIEHTQLLIRAGADINARDYSQETALHEAAWHNRMNILHLLLAQQGIEVNCMGEFGSPLHLACRNISIDGVRALLEHGAEVDVVHSGVTPLMSVSLPFRHAAMTISQDAPKMDVIARMLVGNGASVQQTVRGSTFYTALAAACLLGGVTMLQYLIGGGASAQLTDPVSGRLPHHWAAANGIENFQAIILSYRGEMMVGDKEGKNCLHWAAQMGNVMTVNFIISFLQSNGMLMQYVDRPDSDGWTPLCWGSRPRTGRIRQSETADYPGVVRTLLQHGADREVECELGNGTHTERLTPLELARRCDAGEAIIGMLKYGAQGRPESSGSGASTEEVLHPVRRYACHDEGCDYCFNIIFGLVFKCDSCPGTFICTKCLPRAATFHSADTQGDGKSHTFQLDPEYEEYRDPPLPHPVDREEAGASSEGMGISEGHSDETGTADEFEGDDLEDIVI